jgi:hypothetical protein
MFDLESVGQENLHRSRDRRHHNLERINGCKRERLYTRAGIDIGYAIQRPQPVSPLAVPIVSVSVTDMFNCRIRLGKGGTTGGGDISHNPQHYPPEGDISDISALNKGDMGVANLTYKNVSSRCARIISSAFHVMMCNTLNSNNTIGTGMGLVRRYC